jgi:hypothetical protein
MNSPLGTRPRIGAMESLMMKSPTLQELSALVLGFAIYGLQQQVWRPSHDRKLFNRS